MSSEEHPPRTPADTRGGESRPAGSCDVLILRQGGEQIARLTIVGATFQTPLDTLRGELDRLQTRAGDDKVAFLHSVAGWLGRYGVECFAADARLFVEA